MANKSKKKEAKKQENQERPQRGYHGMFAQGNTVALKWTEEKALKIAEDLIDWLKSKPANFWMQEFLLQRDLYPDIVCHLSKKYPRFSDYITRAKAIQASRIQMFTLAGKMNPGMAQWVLAVHHDMHNVQKTETEVKSSQPIVVKVDADDAKG